MKKMVCWGGGFGKTQVSEVTAVGQKQGNPKWVALVNGKKD